MFVLVDGSSYLYRAYHAMPPLLSPQGQATGAIRGVLNMLQKLASDYAQADIVIVFDAPGKTFRDELYADYKAHRPDMPEDLRSQIAPLDALLRAEGYPLLRMSGVEADDVIASLARRAAAAGHQVVIATGDKDLAQLVDGQIELIDTMKGRRLDVAAVQEKFGVAPAAMVDYLALVGDSADNIPGIPGIGPKTAARLLNEHGSIEAMLQHLDALPARHAESLRAHSERLPLLRQLIRVRDDLPLALDLADLRRAARDEAALSQIYTTLGFRGELSKLKGKSSEPPVAAPLLSPLPQAGGVIADPGAWQALLPSLQAAPVLAISFLSRGEHPFVHLQGLVLATENAAYYFPCTTDLLATGWDEVQLLACLRPLFSDPGRRIVAEQSKVLSQIAMESGGYEFCGDDIELMAYSLETRAASLAEQVERRWQEVVPTLAELLGQGRGRRTQESLDNEALADLLRQRAQWIQRLYPLLGQELDAEAERARLYRQMDRPLNAVLARMERRGVFIDAAALARQSQELRARMQHLQAQARQVAGIEFNLDSPKQLAQVLYDHLQLTATIKTATGQRSTAEDVLEGLSEQHPLPGLVLEYRSLAKLCSNYTDKLPSLVSARSGRLHTIYNAMGTSTGRLSSSEPNLQNIPIRSVEGRRIRDAFVAAPGCVLVAADYSQIELRLMAHLSGDAGLLAAFAAHQDVHSMTAAEIFAVPLAAVDADQRRAAKAINFGLIYGMSAFGLARQLALGRQQAEAYVQRYFERYPGVRDYMQKTRALAKEQGFVETLSGRRIMTPDVRSGRPALRAAAERAAINAPLQGSAADIMRHAMIGIEAELSRLLDVGGMVMQVHDELIIECPAARGDDVRACVVRGMQEAAALRVPLEVSCGVGASWSEAHA